MEMNNDIFTPDLPIPEPVEFEDAPIQRYLKSIILGVAVHHINFREYTHCSVLSKKGRELPDGNSLP